MTKQIQVKPYKFKLMNLNYFNNRNIKTISLKHNKINNIKIMTIKNQILIKFHYPKKKLKILTRTFKFRTKLTI